MCSSNYKTCAALLYSLPLGGGTPYDVPDHAPLPEFRVTPAFPFTTTGIDYNAAFIVRIENGDWKVYICLFTCAASRALHSELVIDLSAKEFIQAFIRFASHHSLPALVMTDNATNFTSGNKIIQQLLTSKRGREDCQLPMASAAVGDLTPSHLMYGRRLTTLPSDLNPEVINDPDYEPTPARLRETNSRQAKIMANLNRVFRHDYLTALREYH
jgi:hypothetical protein